MYVRCKGPPCLGSATFFVCSICVLVIWVVDFQAGGWKLERFLSKNQHTKKSLLNFDNWCDGELSKKWDTILENEVIKKLTLSKKVQNKYAPIKYLSLKKEIVNFYLNI